MLNEKIKNEQSANNFSSFVAEYYNSTLQLYLLWSKNHFHYGIWTNVTKDLEEAMENTTKLVVDYLQITDDDHILDAGCGVGGSSRYIASHFKNTKVTGITISHAQMEKARELTRQANLLNVEFYTKNFIKTHFPEKKFTKIFALESMCYAVNKKDFLSESFRLLKSQGKLVIVDGFQMKTALTKKDKKSVDNFLKGWEVAGFEFVNYYYNIMAEIGYINVRYIEKTPDIRKTIEIVYIRARRLYPFTLLLSKLHLIPISWHNSVIGGLEQKYLLQNKIASYGFIIGEKP